MLRYGKKNIKNIPSYKGGDIFKLLPTVQLQKPTDPLVAKQQNINNQRFQKWTGLQTPTFLNPENQFNGGNQIQNTMDSLFPKSDSTKHGSSVNNNTLGLASAGMNLISQGLQGFASEDHQYTGSQQAVRSSIQQIANIHPIAGAVVAGANMLDSGLQALGIGPSNIDTGAAKRARVKGSAVANQVINSIPGLGILGLTMGKVAKADKATQLTQDYASSFGSSMNDNDAAQKLSGKRMWNAKKASKLVHSWNAQNKLITAIGAESELAKNNSAWQLYDQQNFNKYNGYSPNLLLAKKGMKFPELEEARRILSKRVQSFKNGGVLEDKNLIPEGSLHKNKHDIIDSKPELEDKITEKGIPVIGKDESGEVQQFAEIEENELVVSKSTSSTLEDFYKQYQENPSDELAVECGKFLAQEILKNTDDRTGLIKSVK